jgi:hypothetical protein
MNLKVKAAVIVAGTVASMFLGIQAVKLALTYIPIQVLGIFGMLVVLAFMLSLGYTVVLARLQYESKLKDIAKK